MYKIKVTTHSGVYRFLSEDEGSIIYLFKRLRDYYEDCRWITVNVKMEIRDEEYWYEVVEGFVLMKRCGYFENVVCSKGP